MPVYNIFIYTILQQDINIINIFEAMITINYQKKNNEGD
jgi:hypothetical protein